MTSLPLNAWFLSALIGLGISTQLNADEGTLFRFRASSEPSTLDWNQAHTSAEAPVLINIMRGLFTEGNGKEVRLDLARNWVVSKDGLTYTFSLRRKIFWSDGVELRASHFRDSWIRLMDPEISSPYKNHLSMIKGAEGWLTGKSTSAGVAIEATDSYTLKVQLTTPVPDFPSLLSFWVTFPIRTDLLKTLGEGAFAPPHLVTLGPYVVTSWEKGAKITLTKNSRWPQEKPTDASPGKIEIIIEDDPKKAWSSLKSGNLDIWLDATTSDLLEIRKKEGWRHQFFPYLATYYLGFNHKKSSPLNNRSLREAVALSIDTRELPALLQGGQTAAKGWIPPEIAVSNQPFFSEKNNYKARGAIAQAGFQEGSGLQPLKLLIEPFDGSTKLATHLIQSLKENLGIGIVATYPKSVNEYVQMRLKSDFDLFLGHWGADFSDPVAFLEIFESGNPNNHTNWKESEYDSLIKKAKACTQPKERDQYLKSAEKILLMKSVAIFPLFYKKNAVLIGPRVKSIYISPLNYFYFESIRLKVENLPAGKKSRPGQ